MDAIGFGQGENFRQEPNLRKQVQNCATHGMAGAFCWGNFIHLFNA